MAEYKYGKPRKVKPPRVFEDKDKAQDDTAPKPQKKRKYTPKYQKYQPKYSAGIGKSSKRPGGWIAELLSALRNEGQGKYQSERDEKRIDKAPDKHAVDLQKELESKRQKERRAELEEKLRRNRRIRRNNQREASAGARDEAQRQGKRRHIQGAYSKPSKKIKINPVLALLAAVFLISAVALGAWFLSNRGGGETATGGSALPGADPNAVNGTLAQDGGEPVSPGYYRFVINMTPTMESGDAVCNLDMENVEGNLYTVRVIITDSRGDTLYSSGYIELGWSLTEVYLDKTLEKGTHQATATFMLYDPETLEEMGSTSTGITITVLS